MCTHLWYRGHLNQYIVKNNNSPRPESFIEDWEMAQSMSPSDQDFFYRNIAAGAESGWDFSSRM
jgi:alpha,alpha-trehalase